MYKHFETLKRPRHHQRLLRRKRRNQRPRNQLQQRNQPLNLQRRLPSHQKRLKQSNLRRHQRRSKLLSLTCWHFPPTALLRATQILQKESKLLFHSIKESIWVELHVYLWTICSADRIKESIWVDLHVYLWTICSADSIKESIWVDLHVYLWTLLSRQH